MERTVIRQVTCRSIDEVWEEAESEMEDEEVELEEEDPNDPLWPTPQQVYPEDYPSRRL